MIGRPAWEKELRRRLRSKSKKVPSKKQSGPNGIIATILSGAFMIAVFSLTAEDDAERMVAVTIMTGIWGTCLGGLLREIWQDGTRFAPFIPVDALGMRWLETRRAIPDLIRVFCEGLGMASVGCLAGWPSAPLKALPVAAVSMLTGMLFSSGRWGKSMLWTSGIGATVWSFAGMGSGRLDSASLSYGYLHGWLPAFPLSLWAGDSSLTVPRLAVFILAVMVAFIEWRRAWLGPGFTDPPDNHVRENHDNPADHEPAPAPSVEVDDPRPELRYEVRSTVTRGWIGIAAYVHDDHFAWIDRFLWKSLVPRQRMLACLGIYETKLWLRKVKLSCVLLSASVIMFWTMRYSMERHFGTTMAEYGILLGLPALGCALFAFATSFPGAKSIFEPWTSPFNPGLQQSISPLAIFPISPAEWARCAAREWQMRACLVGLMWSVATVAAALAFTQNSSLRNLVICGFVPWLLLASLLPFSVGGRLLRAHYGSPQGFVLGTRLLFSLVFMVISPTAAVVGIIGSALGNFPILTGGLVIASITGLAGLRLAVASCGNMRTDIAFNVTERS